MATKICNQCGESNNENAYICVQCNSSLKDSSFVGTPDSLKTIEKKEGIRICSHCKERVDAGDIKCKFCGTVYLQERNIKYYPSDETSNSNYGFSSVLLYITTLFVPLVGLIVGGMLAFDDDSDKQSIGIKLLIFGLIILVLEVIIFAIIYNVRVSL